MLFFKKVKNNGLATVPRAGFQEQLQDLQNMNTILPLSSASLKVSQPVICLVQGCPRHHMEF